MAYLYTVRLEKLEFYAYHGVHAGEKELGNRYQTDIHVTIKTEKPITNLSETIDYARIGEIVHHVIKNNSTDLLETLAYNIMEGIYTHFFYLPLQKISVKVSKFNPPIGHICEKSSVELEKEY